MTVITFPTLRMPSTLTWSLQAATRMHASYLSGAVRTISSPGSRWKFSAAWPALDRIERLAVEAFLVALNGRAGRFYMVPPEYKHPRGTATAGTVSGANQTGSTLVCAIGAGKTLLQGDFFVVNGTELKRVTQNATADGSGLASIAFGPPVRTSPVAGSSLILANPSATFMVVDDNQGLTIGKGGFADFTIDAIEAYT